MPSLKSLRTRIDSVKSTQKITSAMKMVAAAKFRHAQEQALAARPYAERMERMLSSMSESVAGEQGGPPLLAGSGRDDVHLVVVATSDRGLCGGFNATIVRDTRDLVLGLRDRGKTIKILCIGRKGRDGLRGLFGDLIIDTIEDVGRPRLTFEEADGIGRRLREMFDAGEFDVCTIVFNTFRSAISQIVTRRQLIPVASPETGARPEIPGVPAAAPAPSAAERSSAGPTAVYEYEPSEEQILADLVPRNLSVQIFRALLENNASEQGARMTAMDNATRNAGDMIDRLTLHYNRTRQAQITKELIEIVSGAEAL